QLESYRHYLDNLLRSKAHVLPPEQERLLAMSGEIAQGPYHIFSMFNNADIKFPTITGEDGNKLEVTKGRYPRLMESDNRKVRKAAFQALYGTYGRWTNTLSATLSAAVKRDIFYARA
ncbi:MAG: oligoendopeptidase F, partial [Calditrichaeota bacterium]|nr:oligoendopeptidase F [Calditrichota bacterium]